MVDPYQVLIDNGSNKNANGPVCKPTIEPPNQRQRPSISLMQIMSVSDRQATSAAGSQCQDNTDRLDSVPSSGLLKQQQHQSSVQPPQPPLSSTSIQQYRGATVNDIISGSSLVVVDSANCDSAWPVNNAYIDGGHINNVLAQRSGDCHHPSIIMGGPSNHDTETIVVTSDEGSNSGDASNVRSVTASETRQSQQPITTATIQPSTINQTNASVVTTTTAKNSLSTTTTTTIPTTPTKSTAHITVHNANAANNTILIEIGEKLPPRTVPQSAFSVITDIRDQRTITTSANAQVTTQTIAFNSSSDDTVPATARISVINVESPTAAVTQRSHLHNPVGNIHIAKESLASAMDRNNHNHKRAMSPTSTSDHAVLAVASTAPSEIDSRKVEPLRIKLQQAQEQLPMAAVVTDTDGDVGDDDGATTPPSPSPVPHAITVPRYTIKPIPMHHTSIGDDDNHYQEAIPKLKIKMGSETPHNEPYNVPKRTNRSSASVSAVTVATAVVNANNSKAMPANELVPKLTIKLDGHTNHHYHHHHHHFPSSSSSSSSSTGPASGSAAEVSLMSDEGIKVTLKPLPEPPLKMTIKTNASNDTAQVVKNHLSPVKQPTLHVNTTSAGMVTNSIPKITIKPIVQPQDETSHEQNQTQSQLYKALKSKAAQRATAAQANTVSSTLPSSASSSSASTPIADENLSTCSSVSASSFSSYSSATCATAASVGGNEDIKLIIKTTPTGSCVVNSTSTGEHARHNNSNATSAVGSDAKNHHESTASSSSATLPVSSTSTTTIPKMTKRPPEDGIVIPKVRIKPLVDPNDNHPKIILKPIPKPSEKTQPLEVITTPHSPFRAGGDNNESQQSPRIILKINKNNATSQTTEAIVLTKPTVDGDVQQQLLLPAIVVSSTTTAATATTTNDSRLVARPTTADDDDVLVLSSDSDSDLPSNLMAFGGDALRRPSQPSLITDYFSGTSNSNDGTSKLAKALQGQATPSLSDATALATADAVNPTDTANQVDANITTAASTALTDKLKSKLNWTFFDNEPKEAPVIVHPLLQHNIERSRLLEVLMNQAAESEANSKNSDLLLVNEGSSSDCIMVEDAGSDALSDFVARGVQNGEKKESSGDRDSGVDVSNSAKIGAEDDATPVKRPRGRPRKDGTPAGSIK